MEVGSVAPRVEGVVVRCLHFSSTPREATPSTIVLDLPLTYTGDARVGVTIMKVPLSQLLLPRSRRA